MLFSFATWFLLIWLSRQHISVKMVAHQYHMFCCGIQTDPCWVLTKGVQGRMKETSFYMGQYFAHVVQFLIRSTISDKMQGGTKSRMKQAHNTSWFLGVPHKCDWAFQSSVLSSNINRSSTTVGPISLEEWWFWYIGGPSVWAVLSPARSCYHPCGICPRDMTNLWISLVGSFQKLLEFKNFFDRMCFSGDQIPENRVQILYESL